MDWDGTNIVRLTTNAAIDADPDWSPDGTRIVFSSSRTGLRDIYSIRPDGTGLKRITTDPVVDALPQWSRTGSEIVFTSGRDADERGNLYTISSHGSNPTALTRGPDSDFQPTWSSLDQIAFARIGSTDLDIWIVDANGSNLANVTPPSWDSQEQDPEWSPDGSQIALTSNKSRSYEIWIIHADESEAPRKVTTNGGIAPSWVRFPDVDGDGVPNSVDRPQTPAVPNPGL